MHRTLSKGTAFNAIQIMYSNACSDSMSFNLTESAQIQHNRHKRVQVRYRDVPNESCGRGVEARASCARSGRPQSPGINYHRHRRVQVNIGSGLGTNI